MFRRMLPLAIRLANKSMLLLGPRQTGKSTLIEAELKDALVVDLLSGQVFRELTARPERLGDWVRESKKTTIVVDEVQKCPEVMDEVQRLLQSAPKLRFLLTGSSARKLRSQGVNLLGGRLRRQLLCPLTVVEAMTEPDTPKTIADLLNFGGLPSVLLSNSPPDELNDYVALYLKEEIQSEALVRNLGNFSRFLEVAALSVGRPIVYANVASDCEVPASTVRDYFQLLEDTLVGHCLPAFVKTKKRKAYSSAKFYFFDVGVANVLKRTAGDIVPGHADYGAALEQLVFCELRAWLAYCHPMAQLCYWRSLSQLEVDFVVDFSKDRLLGIEVKATGRVTRSDTKGLLALREDFPHLEMWMVSNEPFARTTDDGVQVLPLAEFVRRLSPPQ